MLATIAAMMRRLSNPSDEDLEIAEHACRAFAERYRRDAERQKNPSVAGSMVASAERMDRLAERMRRFRVTPQ